MQPFSRSEEFAFARGYRVRLDGTVTNPSGKVIGCAVRKGFYRYFRPVKRGKIVSVHRLVAYQKYGNRIYEHGTQVRHLDGNPGNNAYNNIAIGTASENQFDKPAHIRMATAINASKHAQKHDHEKMVAMYRSGMSMGEIRRRLGISSKGTVSFILRKSLAAKIIPFPLQQQPTQEAA